jgi:hypothetical protein
MAVKNGGPGNDPLGGTSGADTLRGFGGIDTLLGRGGDDVLYYDDADHIDGGADSDELRLTQSGITVNAGSALLDRIEVIDLTGTGNNTLQVTAANILALSDTGVLRVVGNAGDVVGAGAGWTFNGTVTVSGASYFEYVKGGATLQVGTQVTRDGIGLKITEAEPVARLPVPTLQGSGNPWGTTVSGAGDVNGDGFGDFVVGSSKENPYGGYAYVIFGSASGVPDMAHPTMNGSNGFLVVGDSVDGERAGMAVAGGGDFNGDGFADVLVAAPFGDAVVNSGAGRTYIIFGNSDPAASVLTDDAIAVVGIGFQDHAGRSVSVAGDVNGDGYDDFIVGSPYAGAGSAYVIFGHGGAWSDFNLAALSANQGVELSGVTADDATGWSVASAGDINGDGLDDVIVGAPYAYGQAGYSYLVFGRKNNWADLNLSSLNPATTGFSILGGAFDERAGWSVSAAGDVNGDGFGDFLVGAPANRYDAAVTSAGAAYLIFGKADGWTHLQLSVLGTDGVRISGAADDDFAGLSVSAAGDLNADGYDDFIVGAFGDLGAVDGASYVIFGKPSADWTETLDLTILTGRDGFLLSPDAGNNYSGITVSAAGDINGDGFDDLVTAASEPTPHDQDPDTGGFQSLPAVGGSVFLGGDFRGDVNLLGTAASETLIGAAGVDRIVGGLGSDRLDGKGGADVMYGGRGSDTFVYRGADDLRIDGGTGTDRLAFGNGGLTLDLAQLADYRLQNIESVDMRAGGSDTLSASAREILNLSETSNRLTVRGDTDDTLILVGSWTEAGQQTVGGILYDRWEAGLAVVLVEPDVIVI